VELDPITGVIFVSEKDYARMKNGQTATLTTDAFPGDEFVGHITRIAPVFSEATRQARVELIIDNPEHRLKPGMFIRATVVLDRTDNAVIVPEQALTRRGDRPGVFIVPDGRRTAFWREVNVGIRDEERQQVFGKELSGKVVILGQQLLDDGSPVIIPENTTKTGGAPE
jgi:RND family efflux transporter MFP subunit